MSKSWTFQWCKGITLLPDNHSNIMYNVVCIDNHPWTLSAQASVLNCSESAITDKICRFQWDQLFLWHVVLIVISLIAWVKEVCYYIAYLYSPGVIQMVEGGQVTAGHSFCSLHQTVTEEVTTDTIMCKCRGWTGIDRGVLYTFNNYQIWGKSDGLELFP